jgi:arylsulfatase A-like enzyme
MIWPPYMQGAVEKGVLSPAAARRLRASYGAKLSMIDHWLGQVLQALEDRDLADDTLVMVCTDHGHYLGEKDIWGKPGVPIYNTLGHIPLMIRHPGIAPGACDALTTSVDLFATLADLFGVQVRQRTHGRSLLPLMRGEVDWVRDHLLTGVWGREVHLVTPEWKYARAAAGANAPLSMMSNRWSTMPTHLIDRHVALPPPDHRAFLDRMPGSDIPVIHQTYGAGDPLPFWARTRSSGHYLFDRAADPDEVRNLAGGAQEAAAARRLAQALKAIDAPESQFVRLGLD